MRGKIISWLIVALIVTASLIFAACHAKNRNDNKNGNNDKTIISGPEYSGTLIEGDRILVSFDRTLGDTVDASKIVVKKDGQILTPPKDYTLVIEGKNLVIVFKIPGDGQGYTVSLQAGAVEDNIGNTNPVSNNDMAIVSSAETATAASPALDEDQPPYLRGRKIIVSFDKAISILDNRKIKYQLKANTESGFGEAAAAAENPKVVNNIRLEIPLKKEPRVGEMYRISLDEGAIGGGGNTALAGAINPSNMDITVSAMPSLRNVKPLFESQRKLGLTLPVGMALAAPNAIKVESRNEGGEFVETVGWKISTAGSGAGKVNITLPSESRFYTQAWRVVFPVDSLISPGRTSNAKLEVTDEATITLSDVYEWEPVAAQGNKWLARTGHTSLVFRNRIWVLGGWGGTGNLNDVWSSVDGATWVERSAKPEASVGWSPRNGHSSVVFQDKIWVLGGGGHMRLNDVWSSVDGASWIQENVEEEGGSGGWSNRQGHSSVVFQDKIWVFGGFADSGYMNDVWSSVDGADWRQESVSGASWNARFEPESVVFDDMVWILGGFGGGLDKGEVWYSADGRNWNQAEDFHKGDDIFGHSAVVYQGRIWNLAGLAGSRVWSSAEPGGEWLQEKSAPWKGRSFLSGVKFRNKLWILGGALGKDKYTNDVWSFGNQVSEL